MQSNVQNLAQSNRNSKGQFYYDYLVLATNSLINLMKEELKSYKSGDSEAIKAMQDKKLELANFIERQQKTMMDNPEIIELLSEVQKQELKSLTNELSEVSKASEKELSGIKSYLEMLIKAAADAIKNHESNLSTYNRSGKKMNETFRIVKPNVTIANKV